MYKKRQLKFRCRHNWSRPELNFANPKVKDKYIKGFRFYKVSQASLTDTSVADDRGELGDGARRGEDQRDPPS